MSVKERIAELFKSSKQTTMSTLKKVGMIFSAVTVTTALVFTIGACTPDSSLTADDPTKPGIENPGTDIPGIENPGIDDPSVDNPGVEEPGTDEPGVDNPGIEEPGTEEPGTEDPDAEIVVGEIVGQSLSEERLQEYVKEALSTCQEEILRKKFPGLENLQIVNERFWYDVGEETTRSVFAFENDQTKILTSFSMNSNTFKEYESKLDSLLNGSSLVQKILDIAGIDENATIKESEKADLINKLDSATAQYLQSVDSLASELTNLADLIELKQIANFSAIADATNELSTLFGGAEKICVGEFTQPMPYTAGGNITTANCQMANVFTVESDGSVKAYAVTVEEGKTDLSGNVDVVEVGSFAYGTIVENLPELSQPEEAQEVSFDSLYNEVFGEGYDLVPFETFFNDVTDKVFDVASEYKIQFMQLSENGFKLYAYCVNADRPNHRITEALYKGQSLLVILDYSALSKEMEGSANLKDYLQSTFSTNGKVSIDNIIKTKTKLEEYKARVDAIERMKLFTNKNSFTVTTLLENTTADINFDDYAKEYTPEGATPIACYVGEVNPKFLDNTFGTGYTQSFQRLIAYIDEESNLIVKNGVVVVPWYTNSTDDYTYNLGLGEEGNDYIIKNEEIVTLEDPIISSELLPNETSKEF